MIKIIALEREYGAGASVIADQLAARLGWKLLDQSLTDEIAKLARVERASVQHCEEHLDPLLYRLGRVFWRGSFEIRLPVEAWDAFDADAAEELVQRVIATATVAGNCVLVGRGAPWFLHDRADTLRVFLFAPRPFKFQRVLARTHNEAEANQWLDTIDRDRAAFVKHYYGGEWPARHLFHLMLNTAVGFELVVETICQFKAAVDKADLHQCTGTNPGPAGEA